MLTNGEFVKFHNLAPDLLVTENIKMHYLLKATIKRENKKKLRLIWFVNGLL